MANQSPTYKQYGDQAILVQWKQVICEEILSEIRLFHEILTNKNIKQIVDVNFVYSSLLVIYDNFSINYSEMKSKLIDCYENIDFTQKNNYLIYEIPVCYDPVYGIDLDEISAIKKIPVPELIALHSSAEYMIFGCGFLPGFLYLGGLDERLHFPRKKVPRLRVPQGAVAIGGKQTGIYPMESPGGWNIIGNTPIDLFNPNRNPPGLLSAGDKLRFKEINTRDYDLIQKKIKENDFDYKNLEI